MLTRVFKSGNSLAVRIPKDIQFAGNVQEVDIERHGDTLVIRPVYRWQISWTHLVLSLWAL